MKMRLMHYQEHHQGTKHMFQCMIQCAPPTVSRYHMNRCMVFPTPGLVVGALRQ